MPAVPLWATSLFSPASGSVTVTVPEVVRTALDSVNSDSTAGLPSIETTVALLLITGVMTAGSLVPLMLMVTLPSPVPSSDLTLKVSVLKSPRFRAGLTV